MASICHGIEILGIADVIKGRRVTTTPKCRFDATVCGAIYLDEPVVKDGNLICARGKKDISPWMKEFAQMIRDYVSTRQDESIFESLVKAYKFLQVFPGATAICRP